MVTTIIAGNWKMNTTLNQAMALVAEMKPQLEAVEGVQKVVCPPFISLAAAADMLRGSSIGLGAQNMHHEEQGAYTGEISPLMLADICQYVILGHSERRQLFGETDDFINRKVRAALKAGLKPIVCVGESLEDREQGRAEELVDRQVRGSLAEIDYSEDLVVAYEPVWAISTGKAATPGIAQSMMAHIRGVLGSVYGPDSVSDIPLLYGGSVNPGNIADYIRENDVNGALVGGASLSAESFVEIARFASEHHTSG